LGALLYARLAISETSLPDYGYPDQVGDFVDFVRAGTMHDFSYLGGLAGIITGSLYLILERVRRTGRR